MLIVVRHSCIRWPSYTVKFLAFVGDEIYFRPNTHLVTPCIPKAPFLLHFWTALAGPDHFGVSNLVQILLVTEKLNIFVLLVAHLGTAERGGRNVVSGRNVVRSILESRHFVSAPREVLCPKRAIASAGTRARPVCGLTVSAREPIFMNPLVVAVCRAALCGTPSRFHLLIYAVVHNWCR